jgi:hypothetical protein
MAIQCSCPECDYTYEIADELAGKRVLCPECKTRFKVKNSPAVRGRRDEADYDDKDYRSREGPRRAAYQGGVAAHSLGISSLVLGALAFIVSLIPFAGVVGVLVGGLGLLLGIAGMIVALVRQGRGIGFPIAGSALSVLAINIAMFWASLFGGVSKSLSDAGKPFGPTAPREAGSGSKAPVTQAENNVRWDKIGSAQRVDDVSVKCLQARPASFSCKHWGGWKIRGPMLVVELKLTNTSPTKIVKFAGWQEATSVVEDEHGNRYALIDFGVDFEGFGDGLWSRWKLVADVDAGSILAQNLMLHPGKSYITYLFCAKPADISKEARLTLRSKALGGTGTVRLRVPIAGNVVGKPADGPAREPPDKTGRGRGLQGLRR